jgi:hypothetical protein
MMMQDHKREAQTAIRTDIDGEALLRALMAHKRGEPRVCENSRPLIRFTCATRSAISWRSREIRRRSSSSGVGTRSIARIRKIMITALARKLLIALWKYVTAGVVIEGAIMKTA